MAEGGQDLNAAILDDDVTENIYDEVDGPRPPAAPANQQHVNGRVNTAQIKIPTFWKADPELWFFQIEAQFATANIQSDLAKFNQIVGKLDTDILTVVSDIVKAPPLINKYQTLKDRLTNAFKDSDRKKLRILFSDLSLNEDKPSDLHRKMKDKSCNKIGDELLQELWSNRLPQQMQAILTCSNAPLAQQIVLADKIHETMENNSIQAFSSQQPPLNDDFIQKFCKLEDKIDSLQKDINKSRSRPSSRRRSRSSSQSSRRTKNPNWCWYHQRYEDKAIKCDSHMDPPCTFKNSQKYSKN